MFFIRPSVSRFFQLTFFSSKRLQAWSMLSTLTPVFISVQSAAVSLLRLYHNIVTLNVIPRQAFGSKKTYKCGQTPVAHHFHCDIWTLDPFPSHNSRWAPVCPLCQPSSCHHQMMSSQCLACLGNPGSKGWNHWPSSPPFATASCPWFPGRISTMLHCPSLWSCYDSATKSVVRIAKPAQGCEYKAIGTWIGLFEIFRLIDRVKWYDLNL